MLILDIETIPNPEALKTPEWESFKARREVEDSYAGLHPAFALVASVAVNHGGLGLVIRKPTPEQECDLLTELAEFLDTYSSNTQLVGHNIKGFDIPMLQNRMVAHKIALPDILRTRNKKPWELNIEDTMEMLRSSGRYDMNISLSDACLMFSIESPRGDLDGSQTHTLYKDPKTYNQDAERLLAYCQDDVRATEALFNRLDKYL